MIAQVVFDLPIDGPFDYLVPPHLVDKAAVGQCVKVPFRNKNRLGFVAGLAASSPISPLKSIQSLKDERVLFTALDFDFAREFCDYYGCRLGEALAILLRTRKRFSPGRLVGEAGIPAERRGGASAPRLRVYLCGIDQYPSKINAIMKNYSADAKFFILVPDAFRQKTLSSKLNDERMVKIASRSGVFECDGRYDCVIMVDDEDASYKQEQAPMYQTREVVLMRSHIYGFDAAFIGTSPSVELVAASRQGLMSFVDEAPGHEPDITVVDVSEYRFMSGLVSPPLFDGLKAALQSNKKCLLVLNRKGSYRFTRCVDCGHVLKCGRCDSPLAFWSSTGQYACPHCSYTLSGETICPYCHKANWRSWGVGVEHIQRELKKIFPRARIVSLQRLKKSTMTQPLPEFDILISTQAFLRLQGIWKFSVTAFIDFDMELNRLNMRANFWAFSLAAHTRDMTLERLFIQTRQPRHYVLENVKAGTCQKFYDQELAMRKELGFCPFKHWIMIALRSTSQKAAKESAELVYNQLNRTVTGHNCVIPPSADGAAQKREKFIFNVMAQTDNVPQMMSFIKSALSFIKSRKVLVSINVDP